MADPNYIGPASAKQAMILNSTAQITVIGGAAGSGKSYLLQMMPLKIIDDPNTRVIMFRRTTPQITGQGGIFDTARAIYNKLPEKLRPRWRDRNLEAIFPNGAKIKWSHMETEADRFNIQG